MLKKTTSLLLASVLCFSVTALAACDSNDGPAEKAGEKIDNATNKAKDQASDAADDASDAVDDATDGD